jgi:N-acetyl-anhydromuramyl-L-alanine amidase AmpD
VVNQSALSGRRAGVALHFTVSDPGSLNAIFGLFNRRSFGASSNYGFELFNLRCEQWVPEGRKAWAQGNANSAYVSIEIISKDRSRASWLSSAAFKRGTLAALVRDIAKRQGTPLRRVNPSGCVWTPGIVDHDSLECGNTHWDVGTKFPWDVFMKQVRRGTTPSPLTATQKKACDKLNFHRSKAHAAGRWTPERAARAEALKKQVPTGRCPNRYR